MAASLSENPEEFYAAFDQVMKPIKEQKQRQEQKQKQRNRRRNRKSVSKFLQEKQDV